MLIWTIFDNVHIVIIVWSCQEWYDFDVVDMDKLDKHGHWYVQLGCLCE